jgi:N-methylhydantoinase B/oxoprolinase/acetone carboxylase alpha subunit
MMTAVRAYLFCQVAANNKGIRLVGELIEEYGLEVVQAYMFHGTFSFIII